MSEDTLTGLRIRMDNEAWYKVPPHTRDTLRDYVEKGVPPGSFLRALLENNLTGTLNKADHVNRECLHEIVSYCWQHLPSHIWGSQERVDTFLQEAAEKRQAQKT